jgi:hypothetical protein
VSDHLHFAGTKRDGTACTGVLPGPAADLAKTLYDRGYRSARIEDGDGRELGGVHRDHLGLRSWWGER